jgi:hypothetical protein
VIRTYIVDPAVIGRKKMHLPGEVSAKFTLVAEKSADRVPPKALAVAQVIVGTGNELSPYYEEGRRPHEY